MNITVKRNISYVLLASVFALALLIGWGSGAPASYAKSVDDYTMIYDNFNPYTVYNDKTEDYRFGVVKNSELKLDAITLYHYNNGKGKKPGTISILKDGKEIGTWKCTGRYHDQYWDAFPNLRDEIFHSDGTHSQVHARHSQQHLKLLWANGDC